MIELQKLRYQLLLLTEEGKQLDLTEAVDNLAWEEGNSELAARITFSLCNIKQEDGSFLSDTVKPGCMVTVIANWGSDLVEAARGTVQDWNISFSNASSKLDITAYDNLFALQSSQDNFYFPAGTGTKAAIEQILSEWGIPLEVYEGPNESHAKTVFNNEFLSDMILQLLDDAVKKGAPKSVLRCLEGKISILKLGGNQEIFHFDETSSAFVARDQMSIAELVTRVKVVGKEDKEGRQSVEAVVDGKTEFGIRQRIYTRGKDDTLNAAIKAAKELMEESGDMQRGVTLEAPDVPLCRKGDRIHVKAATLDGFFLIESIRHSAADKKMTMELKAIKE